MTRRARLFWTPLFLLLLSPAAGCGRHLTSPTAVTPDRDGAGTVLGLHDVSATLDRARGQLGFFPLTIGNHWRYATSLYVVSVPTGIEIPDENPFLSHRDARLVGTQTIGGLEYVVEEDDWGLVPQHVYWRQDRTGLYEADVVLIAGDGDALPAAVTRALSRVGESDARPAARAAWNAARQNLARKLALVQRLARGLGARAADEGEDPRGPAELTRLLYPLHAGASWDIRTDPRFTSRVEGMDVLTTAAGRFRGWRMRYDSELFGANDVVHVWYGDVGYLGLKAHLEARAFDPERGVDGVVVLEQGELLEAIELVSPDSGGR